MLVSFERHLLRYPHWVCNYGENCSPKPNTHKCRPTGFQRTNPWVRCGKGQLLAQTQDVRGPFQYAFNL